MPLDSKRVPSIFSQIDLTNMFLPVKRLYWFLSGKWKNFQGYSAEYTCGYCNAVFPHCAPRNYHEWKVHPGCPSNRAKTYKEYLTPKGWLHKCRCNNPVCVHCRPFAYRSIP